MIGPLTIAPGGFNHVLVAVDKFTSGSSTSPLSRSLQIEQWISSLTLSTSLDFLILSSQILALTSHRSLSGISVIILALRSSMLQWLTLEQMVK